ncbi:histidine phosphatase family protein [Mesobacillus maritimus]|uniref:histidine phosphatase family protein n=1 Tax=Mesobacillus maritimus TaxID=1643336 RepID=UPI00203AB4DF|nr:histidine phosphatase family protein [Mesobacillus maritimus]MCM3584413.1 histidine phosphatase family protein [Mesobacillus maritimus]
MVKVYVVRHGETKWNAEKRTQGRLDSELTEKGIRDAKQLGERLRETKFQRVISSPSQRTLQTAKLVNKGRSIPIETDERLYEINLGPWQGKTEEEIKTQYPEQFHAYWNAPALFTNASGESFVDVKERVKDFFLELERNHSSGNILIVTHGVVLKTLYLLCRNAPIDEVWAPPYIHGTSLTVINLENGKQKLLLEGCTKHCNLA